MVFFRLLGPSKASYSEINFGRWRLRLHKKETRLGVSRKRRPRKRRPENDNLENDDLENDDLENNGRESDDLENDFFFTFSPATT